MTRSQGAVVILEQGTDYVVLCLRDDKSDILFPNTWSLIGGLVERGESPEQAIKREWAEEIRSRRGDLVDMISLSFLFMYPRRDLPRTEHVFRAYLEADIKELVLCEGRMLRLFEKSTIRESKGIAAPHKDVLLHYLKAPRTVIKT